MNQLISIIIPVYNSEKYIEKCLQSVLEQDYHNIEILIINDGSTDNSESLIVKMIKNSLICKYFKQLNKGVSAARNFGIHNAQGEYVIFVDSDDTIDKDYVSTLARNLKKHKLVVSDFKRITDNEIIHNQQQYKGEKFFLSKDMDRIFSNYKYTQGYVWNKIFNKQLIIKNNLRFNEKLEVCEDEVFYFQYLKYIDEIEFIEYDGYNYYQRKGSLSSKIPSFESEFIHFKEFCIFLKDMKTKFSEKFYYDYYKKKFNTNFRYLIFDTIYRNNNNLKTRLLFLKKANSYVDDELILLDKKSIVKRIEFKLLRNNVYFLLDLFFLLKKKFYKLN